MFKSRTGKEFEFNDDILVTSPGKRFWLRRKYSVSPTWNLGNSNILATWCKELTLLKRPWGWERLRAGGEGDDQGWDGWMASPTQWTWVWVNSRSWWWIGGPGMLQSMGSQRVGHDWVTELNCTCGNSLRQQYETNILSHFYFLASASTDWGLFFTHLLLCFNVFSFAEKGCKGLLWSQITILKRFCYLVPLMASYWDLA